MTRTIAITGKGGVGKSTIAALLIRGLNRRGVNSILAVDADSNVNLNDLLGVKAGASVGTIREEMKEKVNELPGGMTKQQFLEYKVHEGLAEHEDFDLITMGRPEGPGCYCYANNILKGILKTLSDNYEYVIIDNEAGMEHLSRRTAQDIDYLMIVSNPSVRGIRTAGRISRLMAELDTRVGQRFLLLNRTRKEELSLAIKEQIDIEGLELLACLPEDNIVRTSDEKGEPVNDIPNTSPLSVALSKCIDRLSTR